LLMTRVDGVDTRCPPLDHRPQVVPGHLVTDELGVGGVPGHVINLKLHLDVGLGVVLQHFAERRGHNPADHVLGIGRDGVANLNFAEGFWRIHPVPLLGLPAFHPSSNLFLLCHAITFSLLHLFYSLIDP